MPKIIKNGKEYSGVPIEVVTAWEPTGDPVQVKEPLMGNVDISTIGNGTVTGAIDELKSGLTDQTTMNLTLSNATAGGNTSFVTRKGHEVVLFLDYTLNSTATTVTICNLPKIYRPATTIRQIVPAVDSENPAGIFFVVVYPDGDIVSYATKPKRGYITITYPAGN